jgi:hypothetical protein
MNPKHPYKSSTKALPATTNARLTLQLTTLTYQVITPTIIQQLINKEQVCK